MNGMNIDLMTHFNVSEDVAIKARVLRNRAESTAAILGGIHAFYEASNGTWWRN